MIKTSELTGAALDWAVSIAEGVSFVHGDCEYELDGRVFQRGGCSVERRYTTDWAHGGPLIEREMIELVPQSPALWEAMYRNQHIPHDGPTPLIAAMRCFVASKLGDEVDVPYDLIDTN